MKYWGLILFIIVVVILILRTMRSRDMIYEGFISEDVVEEDKCPEYSSCNTCTNASGCAWCPATNKCLNNNTLHISNNTLHISNGVRGDIVPPQCNQNNSIFTSMHCESNQPTIIPPDFTFYKDMIADKPKPPNVGLEYAI